MVSVQPELRCQRRPTAPWAARWLSSFALIATAWSAHASALEQHEAASATALQAPESAPPHAEPFCGPLPAPTESGGLSPAAEPVQVGPPFPVPTPGDAGALRDEVAPTVRPRAVIRTILGLLGLLALAYVAGHPRVVAWEERLGISQVITAGFPFVLLGLVARSPQIGVLGDAVLEELVPLLRLGLGWIGLMAGFRFDTRLFHDLPSGAARVVALSTFLPFALVVGAFAILLPLLSPAAGLDLRNPVFVRDALILGTAAAMTARPVAALFSGGVDVVSRITRLEEVAGVLGLAMIAAFFRPDAAEVAWQLPGTAWVLLTLGMGTAVGLLVYAVLQRPAGRSEFLLFTLASVSFASGVAGYLHLSSVVVAFVAGVLLANFPGSYHRRLSELLLRLERPMYLVALLVIGALWQIGDWRGWVLMPLFAATRLIGKSLAMRFVRRGAELSLGPEERLALSISPIGPLAIAIVINAQLLHPDSSVSLIVSAVIGGGVLTEVLVQFSRRTRRRPAQFVGAVEPPPADAAVAHSVGEERRP